MLHALTLSCDECRTEETLGRRDPGARWQTGTWIVLDLPAGTSGETYHFCGYACLARHASRAARRHAADKLAVEKANKARDKARGAADA